MINLKTTYGKQYKIFMDDAWEHEKNRQEEDRPWYYELRGLYGHAYVYDENTLAVDVTSPRIVIKIKGALKGKVSLFVDRDDGATFLFVPKYFEEISSMVKLRKKRQGRQLSPEEKERLANRGREALRIYRESTHKRRIMAQI